MWSPVPEHLRRRHGPGLDAIDDRPAVRPVLGDRHPDVCAVVIDPARVVYCAPSPSLRSAMRRPERSNLNRWPTPAPASRSCPPTGLRQPSGRRRDLDRRQEQRLADLHQTLGMVRREGEGHRGDQLPRRLSRERGHAVGEARAIGSLVASRSPIAATSKHRTRVMAAGLQPRPTGFEVPLDGTPRRYPPRDASTVGRTFRSGESTYVLSGSR